MSKLMHIMPYQITKDAFQQEVSLYKMQLKRMAYILLKQKKFTQG